jgi:hypothetical protein
MHAIASQSNSHIRLCLCIPCEKLAYAEELKELNTDITTRIETIERKMMAVDGAPDVDVGPPTLFRGPVDDPLRSSEPTRSRILLESSAGSNDGDVDMDSGLDPNLFSEGIKIVVSGASNLATAAVSGGLETASTLATTAVSFVTGAEDGEYCSGGFVSFTSSSVENAARQLVYDKRPFRLEVSQAPDPSDGT